jgi:AAA+ superfamily predicted ATPase
MSDFDRWQANNDACLTARLAWLRSRFELHWNDQATEAASLPDEGMPALAPTVDKSSTRAAVADTVGQAAPGDDAALDILGQRLGLSKFEQDVLLLCAAMEFDTRLPGLCARAQCDSARPYPTFALAMTLFHEPAWDAMSPQRPLRRLRLIEIHQPGATPLIASALRADERIVNFIKGLNYLDDRLSPSLQPFDATDEPALPPSQQAQVDDIQRQLATGEVGSRLPLVQLVGSDPSSKQMIARQIAARFNLTLLRLSADALPTDISEAKTFASLWEREHRLLPIALYIDAAEVDAPLLDRSASPLNRFVARADGLVFLDVRDVLQIGAHAAICVDVTKPTPVEQRNQWTGLLVGEDGTASRLAGQFNLNVAQIQRLATTSPHDDDELWNACRGVTRPRLEALAQRIDARATWDQLVLPAEEMAQLRNIAAQVRHRGRVYDDWGFRERLNRGLGISVLFSGDSGTGKTMAAEVVANELQLDLYRIDLSSVVNKYIGETEKNLRRLFDAADDGGAILLFDEADALFGKRTDVKDSHDRYANIETNYLLQRMEAYRGLAILATNLKSSLDKAFLRRLRFVVNFPMPQAAQRRELWRKAFPVQTPLASLDYDHLARLCVSGGNIHTIALNAAFASADSGQQITMPHLLDATRGEYGKLQKPVSTLDFHWPNSAGANR